MEFQRLELLINDKISNLYNKTILILGIGGVGGYVVEGLARSGIGHLILVDYDTIDITNINRQIIALHSNIGKKKVDCFKDRINDINPNCIVDIYDIYYDEHNKNDIFKEKIDYIVDCCDSVNSKKIIIEEAFNRNIPIISSMGTGNKFHPEMFLIDKLKNTSYDPLAKKMRLLFKNNEDLLNTIVLYSKEESVKGLNTIGSTSFVPSSAGLLIVSYIINSFIKGDNI